MELQTFTSFQFYILLVWSANGDALFQGKFQLQVSLPNDDTYRWNFAMSSSDKYSKVLIKYGILDLLNEESVSGARTGRASLKIRQEFLLRMFEKVSRSLKYDSNIFFVHKHIYIYIWTPQLITLPRSRLGGNNHICTSQ